MLTYLKLGLSSARSLRKDLENQLCAIYHLCMHVCVYACIPVHMHKDLENHWCGGYHPYMCMYVCMYIIYGRIMSSS